MALAEKVVKEVVTRTPERYAARVRWMALIFFALNVLSIAIIVAILWRIQFFITLTQRSNVETLVLLIILALAVYYLLTTFKGFTGSIRMALLNLPVLWSRDRRGIERRKYDALPNGGPKKSAYFDQAIILEGKPGEPITWELKDDAGKMGEVVVDGVEVTYYPIKQGMNDSLFEFVADQIEMAMKKRDLEAKLQITQWSTIDEDRASAYHRMVQAFQNLEDRLGGEKTKKPIWPTVEITQDDVDEIGKELNKLIPALRNESLLPDVEYEVEYSVPILPEPLAFMQLRRRENRADSMVTMGCAGLIMLVVMLVVVFMILLPPWVPSK